mgnify:CR=1 FL=1
MNNYRSIIWRFFTAFFFIFGLLQTLFFARAIFPQFRASGLNTPQTLLCMVSAIILSALYSMICVDGQESLYAIKSRLIICGIPCVLICSVLSVNYGLPSLILDLLGIADRGTGISIWLIAVILSSAVLILALYLLERHYRRVGEKYDSALSQYKTTQNFTIYSDLLFCYNTCLCYHCPNIGFRFFPWW